MRCLIDRCHRHGARTAYRISTRPASCVGREVRHRGVTKPLSGLLEGWGLPACAVWA